MGDGSTISWHGNFQGCENGENGTILVYEENFNKDTERIKHVAAGWDNIVIPAIRNLFTL